MENLGRHVFATACVLASALVAGSPRSFGATNGSSSGPSTTSAGTSSKMECIDGACTALAVADTHCNVTPGNVALASEACAIADEDAAPPQPEIDPYDYEPAWMTGLRRLDIPFKAYPRIEKQLHYWTASRDGRRVFKTWLRRSGKYRADVDKALAARNLPTDLAALVFVESGFSPTAKSKAGAMGLWQLMPSTAKEYGLIVEKDYDERRSVAKSSEAAADHLASLYGKLGSWELVLAAYDMGARALEKKQALILGPNAEPGADFWKLSEMGALPKETAQYVPQILALALVLKNLDRFGYDTVKLEVPLNGSDLDVPAGVPLSLVAHAAGTSVSMLRALNPEFLRDIVPDAATVVHVPANGLARARVMLPHLLFDLQEQDDAEQDDYPQYDWGLENGALPSGPGAHGGGEKSDGKKSKGRVAPSGADHR